jgi:branched-chain amino acid transport system permease protein
MTEFLQQILNGLIVGSIYALVALGYTMVYGILQLINFAHGDIVMVGAVVALIAAKILMSVVPGMPGPLVLALSAVAAVLACIPLSLLIERLAYRPLRKAPRLAPLITAIGVSLTLQTVVMVFFGRNYHEFPSLLPQQPIEAGGLVISVTQILILALSLICMLGLAFLIEKTQMGRSMRAVAESPRVASLMGINTNKVVVLAFAIGAGLAALTGVMLAANYSLVHFYMGFIPGLKAFTAAVLGGIGNVYGAMLGGLILGLVESLGAGYIGALTNDFLGSHYQDIFAFIVLIAVLTLRPSGLMGERVADRS